MDTVEFWAIVISLVALVVTVLKFFASLKFYKDGVDLQNNANNALANIEASVETVKYHSTGIFEKTLDAAISNRQIDIGFQTINNQLQNATKEIVDYAIEQIGAAKDDERKRLVDLVEEKMSLIQSNVNNLRDQIETKDVRLDFFLKLIRPILRSHPEGIPSEQIEIELRREGYNISTSAINNLLHILNREGVIKYNPQNGYRLIRSTS